MVWSLVDLEFLDIAEKKIKKKILTLFWIIWYVVNLEFLDLSSIENFYVLLIEQ